MTARDHLEVPLTHGQRTPRYARGRVEAFLDERGLGEAKQDALVIASELVTNAVVHGTEPIVLEVSVLDHRLRLAVCDGDNGRSVVAVRDVSEGVTTGRGLKIVDALAHRWGVEGHRGGKSVWAELDVPAESAH
jgi:anti-sigma regulatory factor (Ser/Thr protein kinase)